jgi:hypothetical protein
VTQRCTEQITEPYFLMHLLQLVKHALWRPKDDDTIKVEPNRIEYSTAFLCERRII